MDKRIQDIRDERDKAVLEFNHLMALLDQSEAEITTQLAVEQFQKNGPFKARLRNDLQVGTVYGIVRLNPDMKRLSGAAVTVTDVQDGIIQIGESDYFFSTEMLDGASIGGAE